MRTREEAFAANLTYLIKHAQVNIDPAIIVSQLAAAVHALAHYEQSDVLAIRALDRESLVRVDVMLLSDPDTQVWASLETLAGVQDAERELREANEPSNEPTDTPPASSK